MRVFYGALALTLVALAGCDSTEEAPVDFSASMTSAQVVPAVAGRGLSATAEFRLNEAGTRLAYEIRFAGVDVGAIKGDPKTADDTDDLTALHVHVGARGATGGHALNIFGAPAEDDADMTFDAEAGVIRGVWDDSDVNTDLPPAGQSRALSDALALLCTNSLYLQAHTSLVTTGEIRGQIEATDTGACDTVAASTVTVDLDVAVIDVQTRQPVPEAAVSFSFVGDAQPFTALRADARGRVHLGPLVVGGTCEGRASVAVGAEAADYFYDARTVPCANGQVVGTVEVPLVYTDGCSCDDGGRCAARCAA